MDSGNPNAPYLAIAAQIKLLMAAPEKIWSSVENGDDFLTASQMYLFARHVHTCLPMEHHGQQQQQQTTADGGGSTTAQQDRLEWFPVVGRQWAAIAHFYDAILQVQTRPPAGLLLKFDICC